jgi:hypothetical protein
MAAKRRDFAKSCPQFVQFAKKLRRKAGLVTACEFAPSPLR